MSITATFEDGKLVLPPGITLPNRAKLRIELIEDNQPKTLRELLKDFEGIATDLPPDMAENHDHYLYGSPKK